MRKALELSNVENKKTNEVVANFIKLEPSISEQHPDGVKKLELMDNSKAVI